MPVATSTANTTLKEDASASSQTQSSGIIKTASGDIVLTTSASETANSSSCCISELSLPIFLSSSSGTSLMQQNPDNFNIAFLSPETIELEIQIAELISALGQAETLNSEEPCHKHPSTSKEALPPKDDNFLTDSFPKFVRTESPAYSSSNHSTHGAHQSSKNQSLISTRTSSQSPSVASSEKSQITAPFGKGGSIPEQPKSKEKYNELLASAHHKLASSDHKMSPLSVLKSQQSNKDNHSQERNQKQDQQEQEQQEEKDEKKQKKSSIRLQSIVKPSTNKVLSINDLRYAHEMRQMEQVSANTCIISGALKKRPVSPMSLFHSQTSLFSANRNEHESSLIKTPKIENVFIRFMKLMARILGQAEAEANELYNRVKQRTDDVDQLTELISQINACPGDIDWSNNETVIPLLKTAEAHGITINSPAKWSEESKKLFKENVQIRKENLEKITQLERTDMQRHLQEVSQCHQARSNVLKLMKEVMDTFVYNLRP
ncbi:hypothetical protein CP10139811_0454 [Chlamydia ibidis]|uniref:Uncharacterized protein n=1 Tax=Chlamydia ibidis TaxID=1405396 RepID=S7KJY0_9CHLA|nr:hypothetical protein CP10139811_0454 [Chlamydia ibidis]